MDSSSSTKSKSKMSSAEHDEDAMSADERSPLLPRSSDHQRFDPDQTHLTLPHLPTLHSPQTILYALVGTIAIIVFGASLMQIPQTRITEDVICHKYYDSLVVGHIGLRENIDEGLCKGDDIQETLTFVVGILDMLNAVPSIFCAIPYGILADKIGRRPILFLSMVGMLLSGIFFVAILYWWRIFPIYFVFLTPILSLIGGGNAVLIAMINTMVSDVSTEEDRAVNFLFLGAGSLLVNIVAPSFGGFLMKVSSPWVPMLLGMAITLAGTITILIIPETLHFRRAATPHALTPVTTHDDQKQSFMTKTKVHLSHIMSEAKDAGSVLESLSIALLLFTFLTHYFTAATERFSAMYISKRYHWRLSDTAYLMSLIAFINMLLLVFILPCISNFLASPTSILPARYRLHTTQKDLLLARASIISIIIGALLIAGPNIHFVITGLVVFTLGHGFTFLVRSVITSMVDQKHVARLYSLITIVDTLGAVIAGPALPALFAIGMKLGRERNGGDAWLGLPYLGTASICALAAVAVFCARLPKIEDEDEGLDADDVVGRVGILV